MNEMIQILKDIFDNNAFVLTANVIAFCVKFFLMVRLLRHLLDNPNRPVPQAIMFYTIVSSAFVDFGWIYGVISRSAPYIITHQNAIFLGRLGWVAFIIQYHSMLLLIQSLLSSERWAILKEHRFFTVVSSIFAVHFLTLAFWAYELVDRPDRPQIEYLMRSLYNVYIMCMMVPYILWIVYRQMTRTDIHIPFMVRQHTQLLISHLFIPYVLSDLVNMNPFKFSYFASAVQNQGFVGFSALLLAYFLYYCSRHVLNIDMFPDKKKMLSAFADPDFNDEFRDILIDLSMVEHDYQLIQHTRGFIAKALNIEYKQIDLLVRPAEDSDGLKENEATGAFMNSRMATDSYTFGMFQGYRERIDFILRELDNLVAYNRSLMFKIFKRKRIIDYHELDFANFYDQSDVLQMMMTTLENINCDAIIPVFEKYDITAYVIIQKSKPRGEFFDETYKEAVGVFGSYLSGVITNFYHRKRKAFVDEVGLLRQEIFKDKQELKMLKESVKTFLNQQETREVGIFFIATNCFIPATILQQPLSTLT
ncbi:hypothetical protein IPH25_01855 [bacterium]|nr:MAG: hypothetical protein IPH25_01855 [bacterium]